MKWLLKFASVKAYAVFAAVLLALGAAWYAQVAGLKADVSDAKAATADAEGRLSNRVAAEATAVATAVTAARAEEEQKRKAQEVKYAELLKTNSDVRSSLDAAEQRVRKLALEASAARRERDSARADSAEATRRITEASPDELPPEDRRLIGELLQIAGDAGQVAAERNWLAAQYIEHCERK